MKNNHFYSPLLLLSLLCKSNNHTNTNITKFFLVFYLITEKEMVVGRPFYDANKVDKRSGIIIV